MPVEVRAHVDPVRARATLSLHAHVGRVPASVDIDHLREQGSLVDDLLAVVGEHDLELAAALRADADAPPPPSEDRSA